MTSSNHISETNKTDKDPALSKFKTSVKEFSTAAVDAARSTDGKKLPADYWVSIVKLVKQAKLGISMIDLGIDDLEAAKDLVEPDDLNLKKTGPIEPIQKMDKAEPTTSDTAEGGKTASKKTEQPPSANKSTDTDDDDEDDDDDEITEDASSKSQQRLFGMVYAYKKGELDTSDIDADLISKIKKMANSISDKDTKKIAKTKHDDLPEKVPAKEFYDTLNHMSILLSEQHFQELECDGSQFNIIKNDRKFTINFDGKFYMVSENYNFELGDDYDLQEVVRAFVKLSDHSEYTLCREYKSTL